MAKEKREFKTVEDRLIDFGGEACDNVDDVRLNQLTVLKKKFHEDYVNLPSMNKLQQSEVIDGIVGIYVPNVIREFPGLIGRIRRSDQFIQHQADKIEVLKAQKEKAYAYLKWTNNDYFDIASMLPDSPEELSDGEMEAIIDSVLDADRKGGTKRKKNPLKNQEIKE